MASGSGQQSSKRPATDTESGLQTGNPLKAQHCLEQRLQPLIVLKSEPAASSHHMKFSMGIVKKQ